MADSRVSWCHWDNPTRWAACWWPLTRVQRPELFVSPPSLHHGQGNNCPCHRVTASSDTLPFSRVGICIYRNMWILLPENTKQLYSLAHVIISLDRRATRFTLFSNTETLTFTESIGKSWLASYIHIYSDPPNYTSCLDLQLWPLHGLRAAQTLGNRYSYVSIWSAIVYCILERAGSASSTL